jgi:hypothetical protein
MMEELLGIGSALAVAGLLLRLRVLLLSFEPRRRRKSDAQPCED